jgi:hypothetical protein
MSIMAPPLTPFVLRFESDPNVTNMTPTKIMANAPKNNQVIKENLGVTEGPIGALDFALLPQSEHDQCVESKQLLQITLPQSWQT